MLTMREDNTDQAVSVTETNPVKSPKISWFTLTGLATVCQIAFVLSGLIYWGITKGNQTDTTVAALVTVNARLDRIFEKLDSLPVIAEQLKEAHDQIIDGKGQWATLDGRIRAIEQNNAANHADIERLAQSRSGK